MKKIFSISFCLLLISLQMFGQVTVTNSVFPQIGDFRYTSTDTSGAGAAITSPSGSAQVWKFTSFQPWQADTVAVVDAALGGAAASFPNADILFPFFGGEGYFNNTGDSLVLLGFFGDPGFGVSFLVPLNSGSVILKTPATYGNTFQDDFSFVQAIDPDDFPELGPFLPPFPPIDSIRAIYFSHREDTVDAWGSMATHLGTFDVIRAKSVDYTNLAIEFKSFGFWIDPSSLGIEIPFGGLDTSVTFNFLNDVEKEPIVVINTNNDGSISSVVYKVDPDLVTSIDPVIDPGIRMVVFPNPVSSQLHVRIEDPSEQRYQLLLYNAAGQMIQRLDKFSGNGNIITLNLDGLSSGNYILHVQNAAGQLSGVRKIVVQSK